MDDFKKNFIIEAIDLINDLEKVLLSLEERPEDKAIIENAFRIMHSLKGVSAMFGKLYKRQDFISGASILGDGSLALVGDTNKIIKKFSKN